MIDAIKQKKHWQFALLLVLFLILCIVVSPGEGNFLWRLPPLLKEMPSAINSGVNYILFDWWLIDVWDPDIEEYEEKPLMNQVTRSVSGAILFLIEFIREIFLGGVQTIVTFTGWDWATENPWARWPALPWTVVAGGFTILGYALKGPRLAAFVGFTFVYIAVFGQWEPSMQTLSFVLIAAPVSVLLGLVLGAAAELLGERRVACCILGARARTGERLFVFRLCGNVILLGGNFGGQGLVQIALGGRTSFRQFRETFELFCVSKFYS